MNDVGRVLSESIKTGKWASIVYDSKRQGRDTRYWIAIKNVDPAKKTLKVTIFNDHKSLDSKDCWIPFARIKEAQIIEMSYSPIAEELICKIEKNPQACSWLHFEELGNNILLYLAECNRLDCDPFQKRYAMVEGIDLEVLKKEKRYVLSPEQMKQVLDCVYHNDLQLWESKCDEMALSALSIDMGKKKYVVAYHVVSLSPEDKTLRIRGEIHVNPAFLIDGCRHSLSKYTELSADEFRHALEEDFAKAVEMLRENLKPSEEIDTRPDFMLLERQVPVNLYPLFEKVMAKQEKGDLNTPMKAFFGNITLQSNGRRIPEVIVYDKRVNLDQLLVIYNALKNPVTYVQGPPGTGKTQTLFNVIVSAYFHAKTVLVSSMNNKPVDGIVEKLVFHDRYGDIPFPFLRLGNKDCLKEASLRINEYAAAAFKGTPKYEQIEALREESAAKNKTLADALTAYQTKKEAKAHWEFLEKAIRSSNSPSRRLLEERDLAKKAYEDLPGVDEKAVLSALRPASEDKRYLQFLYFSSIWHLNKLKEPRYAELRRVCAIEDDEERSSAFGSWLKNDANMRLLTDAFPVIFSTNIGADRFGSGDFLFDLAVIDEAGQCDIAKSLIPIAKARSLLLVGDDDQLEPVIVLEEAVNQTLRAKYSIGDIYDYHSQSILTCMQEADKVSQRVMLHQHFRCGKKIISFCNQYFYDGKLSISDFLPNGDVCLFDIVSKDIKAKRNLCAEEAEAIVSFIKESKIKDAVIITPFVNQAGYINDALKREGIDDIHASTIHSVQGAEEKTVILSCAVSKRTSEKTAEWLAKHKEIVNVGVSRAKENLYVFGDKDAVMKILPKQCAWNELVMYAASKGETKVTPPPIKQERHGKSNGSVTEDEFFKTISQIMSTKKAIKMVSRNQKASEVFAGDRSLAGKQYEFDEVIYTKGMLSKWRATLIFEFDGGEHVFSASRRECDREKERICKRNGVPLVHIGNDMSKDYEYLKRLIKAFAKEKEEEAEQILLF